MNERPLLIFAGLGALALWALSRTKRGADVLEKITVTARLVKTALTPRGIRNNNPGNIDFIADATKQWRGTVGSDGRFAIFDTAANGVRAIGGELRASIRKGQTIRDAIYEWAPPVENDTDSYVEIVARSIGVDASQRLTSDMIPAAALAIIQHENGQQPYDPAAVAAWVYL